ncbi:amino acid permease [Streptomyces sp. NPDC057580]|uniref:amino acid permease n=1 Tax=Streptomyces sp. NPDC057580 TaxID=3346173 RepID=UPI0036B628D5
MPQRPQSPPGLKRQLGSRQMTMIGIGGAIGTGLFLGSSLAISQAGPAVIVAYLLCALVALVIGWALGEMVVVHPDAGGFGAIAHRYLGPGAGFVLRWTYWAMLMIMVGGELIAVGLYTQYWWPDLPLWMPVAVFAALVLAVNGTAVRFFGESEYWFAMIKVTAIAVFILLGTGLVVFGLPDAPATRLEHLTGDGGFLPHGTHGLLMAMAFAMFSYVGTEISSVTAAEAENPQRDIPRATRAMVLRLAVFYILSMSVVVLVVPWSVTAQGGTIGESPFVKVFAVAGIPAAGAVMNFVVLTAALSSANAGLYLSSRMLHSLAEHRLAPQWAGRLTTSGVPRNALVLSALGMLLATVLSKNSGSDAYLILFGISLFAALAVWLMILATHTAFRIRRRRAGLPPSPFQLRGAPVTTALAAAFLLTILIAMYFIDGMEAAWNFGLPFFLIIVIAYQILKRTGRCAHLFEEQQHAMQDHQTVP